MELNQEQIENMARLLSGFDVAMLTTETEGGYLRSRPMAAPSISESGHLLFFTRAETPKIEEIRHAQQVNLSFAAAEEERYVSVSGVAHLRADQQLARRYWSEQAEDWLPHGFDQSDLRIIEVEVEEIDCWDASERGMREFFRLPSPPARFSSEEDEWQWMLSARDSSIEVLEAEPSDEPPD